MFFLLLTIAKYRLFRSRWLLNQLLRTMQEARHGRHDASRCTVTSISLPGISAAASSTRGEDPWTTGKDPWAQGHLEAFVLQYVGQGVPVCYKAFRVSQPCHPFASPKHHTSSVLPCPYILDGQVKPACCRSSFTACRASVSGDFLSNQPCSSC